MIMKNKRGASMIGNILLGFLMLCFVAILILTFYGVRTQGQVFSQAVVSSTQTVGTTITGIATPLFGYILNFGSDSNNNSLMFLAFILVLIVIVGTLDSINIFGDDTSSKFINFAVGFIVSIIGIRFMPSDIWASLAAPSSAFVATLLVGVPFLALAMVTLKINNRFIAKLFWIFYLVFLAVVIYNQEYNQLTFVYLVFAIVALFMMFFDSTVRRFYYSEMHKKDIEDTIGQLNAQERYNLRRKIENWEKIVADSTASPADIAEAKKQIAKNRKIYGDISAI